MANERTLRALIRFGVDPRSVEEVRRGVKSVDDALGELDDSGGKSFGGLEKSSSKAALAIGAMSGIVAGLTTALINMASQGVASFKALLNQGVQVNKQFETYTTQFETFLKSRTAAEGTVKALQEFNVATPFELPQLVEGAKMLQTFGGAALNTAENWKMVGDAAASVNRPFEQAAFWVGRMYSNLQAGRPFGEAAMAMQEMGIMSGELRTKLEDMQKAGASNTEMWDIFTSEMTTKFEGGAERLSETLQGIESNLADFQSNLLLVGGEAYFDVVKEDAQKLLDILSDDENNQNLEEMARSLGAAAAHIKEMATSGLFELLTPEFFDGVAGAAKDISKVTLGLKTALTMASETDTERRRRETQQEQAAGREPNALGRYLDAAVQTNILETATKLDAIMRAQAAYDMALNNGASEAEALEVWNGIILEIAERLEEYDQAQQDLNETIEQGATNAERAASAEAARLQGLADAEAEAKKAKEESAAAAKAAADEYNAALKKTQDAQGELDKDFNLKRIDANLKFERKRLEAAEQFAQKRIDLARDNAQRIEEIERTHQQRIADAARQYGRGGQDADKEYNRNILDAERELANARVDIEIDYRNRLRDIRRQFDLDADEAVRNQDAIAYLQAVRRKDQSLEEAEITRQDNIAAEQNEAERKREALKVQREREREDEKIDFERKLEDLRLQLTQELEEQKLANERKEEELTISESRKQAELKKNQTRELTDLNTHYNQRYVELKNSLEKELRLVQQYEAAKRAARSKGISSAGGANYSGMSASQAADYGTAFRTRAAGGYADRGFYELGEEGREFVLNAATTRALESALGGQLSQAGIMAALSNVGGKQQTINYNPNYTFNDRDDSRAIVAAINQDVDEKLMRLYRGY